MFLNGTSMSSFVDPRLSTNADGSPLPTADYNPYGTEYLESIRGPLPIIDAITSLRDKGFSDGDIVTILTLNPALAFESKENIAFEVERGENPRVLQMEYLW
jgi:hypothetical protein